jgi:hypothetical protein
LSEFDAWARFSQSQAEAATLSAATNAQLKASEARTFRILSLQGKPASQGDASGNGEARKGRLAAFRCGYRHARACPGHPRGADTLQPNVCSDNDDLAAAWMAGTSPAMTESAAPCLHTTIRRSDEVYPPRRRSISS